MIIYIQVREMIDKNRIPHHVAIIMDGNGRWASKRNLPKIAGHRAGVEAARKIVEAARELGIRVLSLYTFSTENWKRPKQEIDGLFRMLADYIENRGGELNRNKIRFNVIGDMKALPPYLRSRLQGLMSSTKANSEMVLNLAINYGGRAEIVKAAKEISQEVRDGKVDVENIDEGLFSQHLYTRGLPDPDLLIRTSGEMRISNFLLWQICYSEIYISGRLWPDFKKQDLIRAIEDFQRRDRRFGG